MKGIGLKLFLLFLFSLISSSMLKSAPSEYNCSISQGFNFGKDVQEVLGHLNYLKIGDLELSADLTVTDPENISGDYTNVVGIMDYIYWEGGYLDPISFTAQVSNTNKNDINDLIHSIISDKSVQFIFCIYDYDQDEKKYYKAFHCDNFTLFGFIEQAAGEIMIDIDLTPNGEVVSPQNFALTISIIPNNTDQTLHLAVSVSDKFTKPWGSSAVPVELTIFTARYLEPTVQLNWETKTEINNFGFEVQRKVENDKEIIHRWEKIGFVEGHGNSNSPKAYSFNDEVKLKRIYYYRLKQIDTDGKFTYSKQVEVAIEDILANFELNQNYPNPFNPTTSIGFGIPNKANVRLSVLTILGEEIKVLLHEEKEAGYHSIDFNPTDLPTGVYFYQLKAGNYIDTKKMLMLK